MVQVMNFRKQEVTGATKEEAFAQAPFAIIGDATPSYKKWLSEQKGAITEEAKKQFMLNYLTAKKSRNVPGVGYSITVKAAVADTRERPYAITDKKNESGTRKYKTTYQLVDVATNSVVAETTETKAKAKEIAKSLYTNKGFKGDLKCTYTKQVVDGEPIAFEVKYAPSKHACPGVYMVFGIENN